MFSECLAAFLVSMLPVVELRGGIPLGTGLGLPMWLCYLVCILGNMAPVPILLFYGKGFCDWAAGQGPLSPFWERVATVLPGNGFRNLCTGFQKHCGPFFAKQIARAERKAETIGKYELLGIFLFVAIPLPGTGAWTGSIIACILRMRTGKAFLAVSLGVLASGLILAILCLCAPEVFAWLMGTAL